MKNPTILIAEDNLSTLQQTAKAFTEHTGLCVLPASTLAAAEKYITHDSELRNGLSSVFADQGFVEEAQSETLETGLALLELARAKHPTMDLYLYTVHGLDQMVLKQAEAITGSSSRVFPKGEGRTEAQAPWNCVWRDWLVEATRSESELVRELERNNIEPLEARELIQMADVEMTEKVKGLFDANRFNYMFTMGSLGQREGLCFIKPVEIMCRRTKDGSYMTRALGLGVLKEGIDHEEIWEAQNALADILAEHYLDLKSMKSQHLGKFASKVLMNLENVIGSVTYKSPSNEI